MTSLSDLDERTLLKAITFGIAEALLLGNRAYVRENDRGIIGHLPFRGKDFHVHLCLEDGDFLFMIRTLPVHSRGRGSESMDFDIADPESFGKAARAIIDWDVF